MTALRFTRRRIFISFFVTILLSVIVTALFVHAVERDTYAERSECIEPDTMQPNSCFCPSLAAISGDIKTCLVSSPEGEVIGIFPRSNDLHSSLIAHSRTGKEIVRENVPLDFEKVEKAPGYSPDAYFVYAATRENGMPKSFDAAFLVIPSIPSIDPIIQNDAWSGIFGGYDASRLRWLYIPVKNDDLPGQWTLLAKDNSGKDIDAYAFGKDIENMPGFDRTMSLVGAEILSSGDLLVSFYKEGFSRDIAGPFVRFVISPDERKVQAIQ